MNGDSRTVWPSTRGAMQRPRSFWVIVLVFALPVVAMAVIVAWTNSAMRQMTSRWLQAVLASNTSSVELFLDDVGREATRIASHSPIRDASLSILRPDESAISRDQAEAKLQAMILQRPNVLGWALVDPMGRVVATSIDPLRGTSLHLSRANEIGWQDGTPSLVLPQVIPGDQASTTTMMMILHPFLDEQNLVGAIGWVMDPWDRFSELMAVSRTGETDETYAIDRQGRILSRSRFGDCAECVRSSDSAEGHFTLTSMADQATRGSSGVDSIGYVNHRGSLVVGAWRWLPQHDMAIATEIGVDEAYRPVAFLRRAMIVLFVAMAAVTIGMIADLRWFRRTSPTQSSNAAKRQLGPYELTELIGVGGMGSVYRGRHQFLRRDVAIKVLEGARLSTRSIERFRREVQLTATLRHPNTIAIFDYGHHDSSSNESRDGKPLSGVSSFYYVMEYVEGVSLQQLIDTDGAQSPERTIHLLLQVCGAISEAHQAGLIHRDIKPANLLVSKQEGLWDHVKVLDFGLVKELDRSGDSTIDESMTRAESITGTPLYMAPETIRDATAANPLSDLYSIGAVGYALLTGRPTFDGESAIDLCLKQLQSEPMRPQQRLGRPLPSALQDLLMRCLSVPTHLRPQSVMELADELASLPEANHWTAAQSQQWWSRYDKREHVVQPVKCDQRTWVDESLEVGG